MVAQATLALGCYCERVEHSLTYNCERVEHSFTYQSFASFGTPFIPVRFRYGKGTVSIQFLMLHLIVRKIR